MGFSAEGKVVDLSLNMWFMRLFNMMALEERGPWRRRLQHAMCVAMVAMYCMATASNLAGMARVWGDFESFVTATCTTTAILVTGLRYCYFVCRREDMLRLARTVASFQNVDRPPTVAEEHASIMRKASRHSLLLTHAFTFIVLLMAAAWTMPSLARANHSHNTTTPRTLPFQTAYFFDHEPSPLYELVYCFQVTYTLLIAGSVISYDTATVAFLIHVAAQLETLAASLRHVALLSGSSRQRRHLLVHTIHHHSAVTQFIKELDNIYHPFMLMQFLYSVAIISLSVFLATESSADSGDAFKFLALVLASSSELYLCCRYGDNIIQLSGNVATAAFSTEWYEEDKEFQSMVLLMIMRAQKPVKLTAFHYKDISLKTYGALLNTSYTYFALLKELK